MDLVDGALYACPECGTRRPFRSFLRRDGIGLHILREHPGSELASDVRTVRDALRVVRLRAFTRRWAGTGVVVAAAAVFVWSFTSYYVG